MNNKKVFSRSDYNTHDTKAKDVALEYLTKRNINCSLIMENYHYDLEMEINGEMVPVEVEHKLTWRGKTWPKWFSSVDVPYRKIRNTAKVYMLFNEDYSMVAIASMDDVKSSPTSTKNTKYTRNEMFFNVDPSKFKFCEV